MCLFSVAKIVNARCNRVAKVAAYALQKEAAKVRYHFKMQNNTKNCNRKITTNSDFPPLPSP